MGMMTSVRIQVMDSCCLMGGAVSFTSSSASARHISWKIDLNLNESFTWLNKGYWFIDRIYTQTAASVYEKQAKVVNKPDRIPEVKHD